MNPKSDKQINIELGEKEAEGTYSNLVLIYEILGSWDPYKHGTFLMTSFLVSLILLTWAVYFA